MLVFDMVVVAIDRGWVASFSMGEETTADDDDADNESR